MVVAPPVTATFVLAIMWGPGPGHTVAGNSPEFHSYSQCMDFQPKAEAIVRIQFEGRGSVICVPKEVQ